MNWAMTLDEANSALDMIGRCVDVLSKAGRPIGAGRVYEDMLIVANIARDILPKLPPERRRWLINLGADLAHAAGAPKE